MLQKITYLLTTYFNVEFLFQKQEGYPAAAPQQEYGAPASAPSSEYGAPSGGSSYWSRNYPAGDIRSTKDQHAND